MTDPDDCPCLVSAESGTCPHGDRGLWAEFDNTPPAVETHTDTDQAIALVTGCAEQTLDLLLASAADDPRMPAWLVFAAIPEWAIPATLIAAVNRLAAHG